MLSCSLDIFLLNAAALLTFFLILPAQPEAEEVTASKRA
jgi:hypothetical protein